LAGFEECATPYVLQMDGDCLVGRNDRAHDYLGEMLEVFDRDPTAITVAMTIPRAGKVAYTSTSNEGKWRTEVRCSLLSLERLGRCLPLPNAVKSTGRLQLSWHRSLDRKLAVTELSSYRGGDPRTWFIHVPNARKSDVNDWFNITKAVERGHLPAAQLGEVDLVGSLADWLGRRDEALVFVVRGRNVPVSRLARCLRSIERQEGGGWGIVLIDAGSGNGMEEYLTDIVMPSWSNRATLYLNLSPATPMENNFVAIRTLCSNPESIIVTVDADDQLIGSQVLSKILNLHQSGSDLTIGSMLRTDKHRYYPVTFHAPRTVRGGGNVWQHLRTFRKRLFDAIREEDLKVDGSWVPEAEDWAFMLPMAEMARNPVHVSELVYWYEPSAEKGARNRAYLESIIAAIVRKPVYGVGS
jgi:hypothetical protein